MSSYAINKRWRLSHPEKRNEGKLKNYAKSRKGAYNKNKLWTGMEDELVLNSDMTDFELHSLIGRTVQSIQIRRCVLKKEKNEY